MVEAWWRTLREIGEEAEARRGAEIVLAAAGPDSTGIRSRQEAEPTSCVSAVKQDASGVDNPPGYLDDCDDCSRLGAELCDRCAEYVRRRWAVEGDS